MLPHTDASNSPISRSSTGGSSVSLSTRSLQLLVEEYKSKFTAQELESIFHASGPRSIQSFLQSNTSLSSKTKDRLANVTNGLDRYNVLFAVVGAASPDLANMLWGGLNLVQKKSTTQQDAQEVMGSMLEEFCALAPHLESYEMIFAELHRNDAVQSALLAVYRAWLDFFYESNQWMNKYPSGLLRHAPKPQPVKVRSCLERINKTKMTLESEVSIASLHLHEGWHREIREMLSKVTIQPKGSLPCRMIAYPSNPRFVGRDDILDQMDLFFREERSEQATFALHGTGGVGKTQIALKYVDDHLDHYPAVFWMNADSRAKLTQSYVDAAKQLQIEPQDSQRDQDAVAQSFKAWLGDTTAKWIIIYDNADDLKVLGQFWPPTKTGSIIITSRDPASSLMAKSSAHVPSMTQKEGLGLFLSILQSSTGFDPDEFHEEKVEEVSKQLGHLPLALTQAANFIAERECTVDDFLEIYSESLKDEHSFAGLDTDSPNLFYQHSLATVWKMSIAGLSQDSKTILSILSCLDPDGVPETMIRQGVKSSAELKSLSGASTYTKAVKELLRNGLIWKRNRQHSALDHQDSGKPVRSVSLHRLIQEAVFYEQSIEDQSSTLANATEVCLNVFPHPTRSNFRLMQWWPECEQCLPHVLALDSRYRNAPEVVPGSQIAELFLYAAWYLYERRAPELALPLLNTASSVCDRDENTTDWFLRSRIVSAYGCVLFECSRYQESEDYFRQALSIRLANVSQDDILLAHGYQDTALPVSAQGRYTEAIGLQKKALEIIERNDDDFTRRDMMFHVHHNMARTYEASGNPSEALRLHFHQGDEFGNGLRTEASESGAVNLYAIGNCFIALGDHQKGYEYHSRSLKIRKKLVGDQGFYYGISLHKMGLIMVGFGELESSLEAFQNAEIIFQNSQDAQRELSRTLFHLSRVEFKLGRKKEAELHLQAAWSLRSGVTGEKRPRVKGQMEFEDDQMPGFDSLVIYIHA